MIVWTLQRYLFREMGREFLLTALGLIATLSLGGGVLNMIQVEELTARQLVKLMALVIPVAASLTLPIAAMFSAAATYGRLASDNEFVACRASGINTQILLLPALAISLGTAVAMFFCINSVIPTAVKYLDQVVGKDLRTMISQRLRRPGGRIPGWEDRRMYWDDAPDGPEELENDFFLRGAAFLKIAEPGVLSFRELPGTCLNEIQQFIKSEVAVQKIDHFFITERLPGGTADWFFFIRAAAGGLFGKPPCLVFRHFCGCFRCLASSSLRVESPHFIEKPLFHHSLNPMIDSFV